DPSTVFSRRFGDCKDKSLLFVAIVRALGFQAFPVLVNSTVGRAIYDWQPGASDFDHCIAVVQCYGHAWWLDPTMTCQRGPLSAHYLPAYGYGLIIAPGTTALTAIPQTTGLPETTTTEYFHVGLLTDPATLKVVTLARGEDADVLRATFATVKQTEIENTYTHYYSDTYPDIKMAAPIQVADDEGQDSFQTTESYTIDKIWTQPKKGIREYECQFYPGVIAGLFKKPVDTDRAQPLGIDFPEHQILRAEVTLPGPWPQGADQKTVTDPAFTFQKLYQSIGNRVVMQYKYQATADSLAPNVVPDHLQHLDECNKLLGDTIIWKALR
ncbi:MAG: transglutaminase-like domain-containing protein, partial [Limisphaerales bacterium]